MKETVYNVKTGEPAEVDGVDAREYIATGGWANEPPAEEVAEEPEEKPEQPEEKTKRGKAKDK